MRTLRSFDYAVVRIVPRVEREEFLNVGVVVFCADHEFLKAVFELDEARLRALSPVVDLDTVADHLHAFARSIDCSISTCVPRAASRSSPHRRCQRRPCNRGGR